MSNTKKYVSLDKLGLYDEKIKKYLADADTAVLDSAKSFAESLSENYEQAGAVATAQEALQKNIDAVDAKADAAQAAADAAQGEVDALEILVGTLPSGTAATSVVDYVNLKTSGIATDAALGELNNQVSGLQTVVNGIVADYLTSEDKTELSDAISAEADRADKAEKANAAAIKAISDDYLKAADKTELQGNIDEVAGNVGTIAGDYLKASDKTELEGKINAKVAQTAYDAKVEEIKGTTDSLQTQINTIMNNPDAEGAINSINEFTAWVNTHGTIADGMRTDINANAKAIEDEAKAARAAEDALSGRLDTLEAINHDAYIAADTALENKLNAEIAKKAVATEVAASIEALQGVDTGLGNRIAALEAKHGDGEGTVESLIATAKQEAIDAAANDATSKANAAETAAKAEAARLDGLMNTRVEALEAIDHEHANKALLDTYTQTEVNLADAVAKKHAHTNLEVLEGITSTKVTAWDNAEQNAKTYAKNYADGLNTAMNTRVEALESWHENFVECSQEDIQNLFKVNA